MKTLPTWRRLLLTTTFLLAASTLHAANTNARIKGTVVDSSGAVIALANVTATNQATGVKFTTVSQADGGYLFPQLPIGTYTISVEASGFKSFSAKGIVLNIDQEYIEPVKLGPGANSETVTVDADPVQVNTTDSQFSNIVNSKQMVELPLIGRSFTGLELTLPGVQLPDSRFSGNYSVSGAQSQQSEYLINGADTNDIALNTIVFTPILDAIDQFNLLDGPLNAEYDRNSGGIVSATIKQGTNHFHGDIYEFYRDTFLNTQNFLQKTYSGGKLTSTTNPYHQNIFGGTIGGPIWRDKLFFFGAYEGVRESVPQTAAKATSVLSSAMLGGNFSADLVGTGPAALTSFSTNPIPASLTIPGCTTGETWKACLTPKGGILPTSALNSVALNLAKTYVPAANNGTYGIGFNETEQETTNQYIGRIDFAPNSKNQITVLGIYFKSALTETLPFLGATLPGFGDGDIEHIQQWTGDYVRQINATTVNDLAAHYTRFNYDDGTPQQIVQPGSVGFAITPQDTINATVPAIDLLGYFQIGGTVYGPQPRIDEVIQLDDTLTKTIGRHNIKIGYDGRKFSDVNQYDSNNSGSYSFNGSGTYSTGDPALDYLLGVPDQYVQSANDVIQTDAFLNYMFAQDSWRVTNNLTLNYGLSLSIDTPLRNHQFAGEAISCFIVGEQSKIFPNAPTNLVYPGDPGCTNSGQAYTRYSELGPRFGFAWAPDLGFISGSQGKFSIRGGFGMYYNRNEAEGSLQTLNTPPFGLQSIGAADFGGSPAFANPFADINNGLTSGAAGAPGAKTEPNQFPFVFPVKGQAVTFAPPIFNISSFDKSFRAPYAENFQLTVEREFPSRIIARASYVGSLGRHNQTPYEGNYETAAGHTACLASPACIADANYQARDYPANTIGKSAGIVEEGLLGSYGASSYSSAQISITKAETHGLTFQLSYTYAHALDNASSFESAGFGTTAGFPAARGWNQFNKALNYGDSSYDARHHLVFSPVYIVPGLHGRSAYNPLNLLASGWQISGITQVATGLPYDIAYTFGGSSNSLYCSAYLSFYNCPDIPQQIAPLVKSNPRVRNPTTGASPYFSKASFAPEPVGSFGNIHRNPYHGPGNNNTNLIVAKNINLRADGTIRLQLRMESDNVFNHTQFELPNTTYGSGSFGTITTALSARQTQIAGKLYF